MAKDNEVSEELYNKSVFQDGGSLVIDLGNIEEAKFELIPKGFYDAEIDTFDFGTSENSGAPMFTATFQLTKEGFEKVKLRSYFSFSPKALPYTKASLNRFARDIFGNGAFDAQKISDSGVMLGRKVRLKVKHQDYEGDKRAAIDQVLPPEEGTSNGGGKSGGGFFS
jgi:hypothetical protein